MRKNEKNCVQDIDINPILIIKLLFSFKKSILAFFRSIDFIIFESSYLADIGIYTYGIGFMYLKFLSKSSVKN